MNLCISIFFLLSSVVLNAAHITDGEHALNTQAYNRALDIICRYKAFMEDYLEFTENELKKGKYDYDYNKTEIRFHIRTIEEEKDFIDNLNKNDKKFTRNMLRKFLKVRFNMLDYRFDLFRRKELIDDGSERMYEKISCNTTMCQFYDQLITDIYFVASQQPLSSEIHSLISVSPSLWPLLTGTTEELPNPDQATYGKLNDRSSLGLNGDLYLFKTYYVKNELFQLPVYGLGAPKGTTIATWMTPYQRSRIDKKYRKIEERQFPEWLQITKAQPEELSRISPDITPPLSEQAEVLSHDTQINFAESQIVEALATVQMQEKTTTISRSTETVCTEAVCDIHFVEKARSINASEDALREASRKNNSPSSSVLPRLAPKGMRAFHPHAQTFRVNSTKLNNKHLNTFSKLMESGYSSSLSYADYSSLWRAINGENSIRESTGSSHKILLDADGKIVAGIFAHNKGMNYTKRTFSYLRDAISRLGIDAEAEL